MKNISIKPSPDELINEHLIIQRLLQRKPRREVSVHRIIR
jgi:hypothetical protein